MNRTEPLNTTDTRILAAAATNNVPCTPPGSMMPLMLDKVPMAPRPRKRIYCTPDWSNLENADIFLPLIGCRNAPESVSIDERIDVVPRTPPHTPALLTAPPPVHRAQRRRISTHSDNALGELHFDMTTEEDELSLDMVRISHRLEQDDGLFSGLKLDMKWPEAQVAPLAASSSERRYSCSALCA